jgi:hypothetical protein
MVHYCSVPLCNSVGGFRFPRDKELKKKWQIVIKRSDKNKKLWQPKEHDVVCEHHFTSEDFKEKNSAGFPLKMKRLKEDVVPSVFEFLKDKRDENVRRERSDRVEKREKNKLESDPLEKTSNEPDLESLNFAMEVEIFDDAKNMPQDENADDEHFFTNTGVQTSMDPNIGSLKISQFENNPKAITYYTSFKDIEHFRYFLDCLGPAAMCLSYSSRTLSFEDELFLCLIKLRQNKGK